MIFRICALVVRIFALLLTAVVLPAHAQNLISKTSGFSGYLGLAPAYFSVSNSLLVGGAPLLDKVGDPTIRSIFAAPGSNSAPRLVTGGEISYTFASTRTQVFFGNRLEDLLRLDVSFGLGIRQEMPDGSILAASALGTPLDLKVWSDPYIEGVPRTATQLNNKGARLRWGGIFDTGLELTGTWRKRELDAETSGTWLVGQNRLPASALPLLNRDGDIWNLQALYRVDIGQRHRLEPAFRYFSDDLKGAAMADTGTTLQMTYLFFTPTLIVDVNALFSQREAEAVHPVYDQRLDRKRYGAGLTLFFRVRRFENSALNLTLGGEYYRENANIAFFDSEVASVNVGFLWRHIRQ